MAVLRKSTMNMRKRHVARAKKRAEQEESFFSGPEAFTEVAKEGGVWNWALVGPDPEALPLSGGGSKGVEEMREAFANHAHSFGLLRMEFGVEPESITKYLFIHAADEVDSGNFSRMERGQAGAMEPLMEDAIRKFAPYSAKINIRSKDEATVENLVDKLRSVVHGVDSRLLTVEHFHAAVQRYQELHPEQQEKEQKKQEHAKILQKMEMPRAEVAVAEPELPEVVDVDSMRMRKKVKLFSKGDVAEVYSVKHKKWFLDAEITEVAQESCYIDGFRVVAGSMKIVYDNSTRFKWVAPHEMEDLVRESPRPRPPEPLSGELYKQQHFWFVTHWSKMYFELHKGFIQWWGTREEAQSGSPALGSVYLLGLRQQTSEKFFKLQTDSTEGAVHAFQADTAEETTNWVDSLWVHAGYCEEMCDFYEAKMGGVMVRKELMNVMMRRELLSVKRRVL